MPSIQSMAALAASVLAVTAAPLEERAAYPLANGPPYLNQIAQANGKLWFGTAADVPGVEQQNVEYMTILNDTRIFGEITPANYMKFEQTEPERNVFNFTGGNVVVNIAEDHGKYVRCHNLIWQTELPYWLTSQTWSNATLQAIMKTHIETLVQFWGGRCYSWDVVNEALNGDGTFASNIWYDTIGEEYFFLAFKYANAAVKKTGADIKLYYNDYGIEYPGAKQAATAALVQRLQAQKINIDGIGLESHWIVGETPGTASQMEAMASYTSLGLDVVLTELDVRFINATSDTTPAGYATQALDYYNSVTACMDTPRCKGITVWDFDDEYSWIPSTFAGQGAADLYNANFTRKPAYKACAQALNKAKCTVCG